MRDLPLVGDEFAGYRLLAVIGRGGMSTVYRAENPRLGNVIALKVMAPELAEDDIFRARFLEESRIAAGLNHPNVVPIHDSGSSDGLLYIAMRYVTGTDLRQMLKKRVWLSPETAVFLLSQAARALDVAHRRGLVHRDVKPGNLLVEQPSDDADPYHLYLTDFGITKHAGEHTGLTATGEFMGTVDYIAPEQVRGLSVLGMADQYSLGCVLYECLTGRVPFDRDMNAAKIWAHVEDQPTLPTVLRPDLPRAVNEVFARVLAKQPGDRYGSCREFMAAAQEALDPVAEPRWYGGHPPQQRYQTEADLVSDHPAEIVHEPVGVHSEGTESIPGQGDRPWDDRRDWRGGRASVRDAAALGGPGDSQPSGRPPDDGRGRGRRRDSSRTPRWIVISAVVALAVAAGIVAWVKVTAGPSNVRLSANGTGSSHSAGPSHNQAKDSASASPSPSQSMNMGITPGTGESGPGTLAGVLAAANNSVEGKGLLPFDKCGEYKQNATGQIICMAPVPGVKEVFYQNYSSLTALYSAYESQIEGLDGGTFRQNTSACGNGAVSYAEFGWNQEEGHPHNFTVAQMVAGQVPQIYASGRMACFATRTPQGTVSQDIVWTINNGPALGVAIGDGSPMAVYQLWASLHHAVLFRGTMMCGTAGRMNMNDIPTGNLEVEPACPAGVQAVPVQ
jgi:serine/threonine protein kinase